MNPRSVEKLVIGAVALHSLALGLLMLLQPASTLRFFGWDYDGPMFFPSQSGVFLFLLGMMYLAGVWYRPCAWLLVASKATAVLFLVVQYKTGMGPAILLLAALLDGLMGLTVAIMLTWTRHLPPEKTS